MIAAQLIVVLAGIYIVAKGKVAFSKNRELVRPASTIFGLLLVAMAILPYFVSAVNDVLAVLIISAAIIVVSYFFSKKIQAI